MKTTIFKVIYQFTLLENVDNKISIYIIHKDPKSFENIRSAVNHPKAGLIKIHKFEKNINFQI